MAKPAVAMEMKPALPVDISHDDLTTVLDWTLEHQLLIALAIIRYCDKDFYLARTSITLTAS